jgi:hypothetical protein
LLLDRELLAAFTSERQANCGAGTGRVVWNDLGGTTHTQTRISGLELLKKQQTI